MLSNNCRYEMDWLRRTCLPAGKLAKKKRSVDSFRFAKLAMRHRLVQ